MRNIILWIIILVYIHGNQNINKDRNGLWSKWITVQGTTAIQDGWGEWSNWSNCSVSCGFGTTKRIKLWHKNGAPEDYSFSDIVECWSEVGCSIQGLWGPWGPWTECTAMCHGGFSRRSRTCNYVKPATSGKKCHGRKKERRNCNTVPCPEIPSDFRMSMCNVSSFICKSGRYCVAEHHRCDHVLQCDDGSDERRCPGLVAERTYIDNIRSVGSHLDLTNPVVAVSSLLVALTLKGHNC